MGISNSREKEQHANGEQDHTGSGDTGLELVEMAASIINSGPVERFLLDYSRLPDEMRVQLVEILFQRPSYQAFQIACTGLAWSGLSGLRSVDPSWPVILGQPDSNQGGVRLALMAPHSAHRVRQVKDWTTFWNDSGYVRTAALRCVNHFFRAEIDHFVSIKSNGHVSEAAGMVFNKVIFNPQDDILAQKGLRQLVWKLNWKRGSEADLRRVSRRVDFSVLRNLDRRINISLLQQEIFARAPDVLQAEIWCLSIHLPCLRTCYLLDRDTQLREGVRRFPRSASHFYGHSCVFVEVETRVGPDGFHEYASWVWNIPADSAALLSLKLFREEFAKLKNILRQRPNDARNVRGAMANIMGQLYTNYEEEVQSGLDANFELKILARLDGKYVD